MGGLIEGQQMIAPQALPALKRSACSSVPLPWEQDHGAIAAALKANNGLHLGRMKK